MNFPLYVLYRATLILSYLILVLFLISSDRLIIDTAILSIFFDTFNEIVIFSIERLLEFVNDVLFLWFFYYFFYLCNFPFIFIDYLSWVLFM
jgi:hypothetical protein